MTNPPKIITLQNKKLVGQSIKMSLIDNKTLKLFSCFMPQRKYIQNTISSDVYEVLIYNNNYLKNFSPANIFKKWAAVEVENFNDIPEGMDNFNLDSGLYAVFNYKGLPKDFGLLMSYIYSNWLPKSKYKLDQRPHFNLLGEKAKRNHPDSEEEVWIPIKI